MRQTQRLDSYKEGGEFVHLALHNYVALHQTTQLARNVKPKTVSVRVHDLSAAVLAHEERPKQHFEFSLPYSYPKVSNLELQELRITFLRPQINLYRFAFGAKLYRIANQVSRHLLEPLVVEPIESLFTNRVRQIELDFPRLCSNLHGVHHFLQGRYDGLFRT